MNQNTIVGNSQQESNQSKQPKIIKRYGNRKLYDTEQSSYVVLSDIAKMIRNKEEVRVIDNETKDDITNSTLTQIIFGAEKKSTCSAPLDILKNIIMKGDGSLSNFLAEMGLFKPSPIAKEATMKPSPLSASRPTTTTMESGTETMRKKAPSLEERIVNAASSSSHDIEENELPELPNSNKSL